MRHLTYSPWGCVGEGWVEFDSLEANLALAAQLCGASAGIDQRLQMQE